MKLLSREEILNAKDMRFEEVHTPEWGEGVGVRVHVLSGVERDAWEERIVRDRQKNSTGYLINIRARLTVMTVRDESGKPLFTDADIELLGKKSAAALDRVFSAAMRINRLSPDEIKELEGNSEPAPSGGPGSN